MRYLAISGSARRDSTNTALLRALARAAQPDHVITVFDRLDRLPVFSPDRETGPLPAPVAELAGLIGASDGLIISSPEYARAIPGGLKNAIDWMVSRNEMIAKPVVLTHASHRGEDMLAQLRLVLSTISSRFDDRHFLRFDLMKMPPGEIAEQLSQDAPGLRMRRFLQDFATFCAAA